MDKTVGTPTTHKRKPEEEFKNSDTKRKATPRGATVTMRRRTSQGSLEMSNEETPGDNQALFDNLKFFIVERSDSSTQKMMAIFNKVNGQVEKNSTAIEEIKDDRKA